MAADKPRIQQLGDIVCPGDEVVKTDGSGGWECSPDPTGVPSSDTPAELDCLPGDVARLSGTEWECSDAVSRLELFEFGKRVFLSSLTFDGDFGELTGADATCQVVAGSAGLPGMYRAWLPDGSGGPTSGWAAVIAAASQT